MSISESLRQLITLAEQLETSENEITELAIQNTDLLGETGQEVDLTVELPFPVEVDQQRDVDLAVTDATVTDAGTLSVGLTARIGVVADGLNWKSTAENTSSVNREETDSTANEVTDGGTSMAVAESASASPDANSSHPSESSSSEPNTIREASAESSADAPRISDPDRPAYKDPGRLAEVYDPDRTFEEMAEELGVDVTPKTVRHYMVEHGIHKPDSISASDADKGESLPAYKDPEQLVEVYRQDRTFEEMTAELGVDVTPKTVRHYMVEHGIHDPNKHANSEVGDDSFPDEVESKDMAEEEIASEIAKEVELPDDVSLSDVTEAVCTAKTLFEVQRELGIDRDQTQQLLSELNLLELVHGRLSTTSSQSRSREEVEDRIKEAVTKSAVK